MRTAVGQLEKPLGSREYLCQNFVPQVTVRACIRNKSLGVYGKPIRCGKGKACRRRNSKQAEQMVRAAYARLVRFHPQGKTPPPRQSARVLGYCAGDAFAGDIQMPVLPLKSALQRTRAAQQRAVGPGAENEVQQTAASSAAITLSASEYCQCVNWEFVASSVAPPYRQLSLPIGDFLRTCPSCY